MIYIFQITSVAAFLLLLNYHMHMFQLNSYSIIEEKRFIKENIYPIIGRVLGTIISIFILVMGNFFLNIKVALVISIILNIFEIMGNFPSKNVKIPLRYTNRVIRMMVTSTIIYILIFTFSFLYLRTLFPIIIQILSILTPLIILFSNAINRPIENSINQGYIREATDKIATMTNLIVIGITGSYGKTTMKIILDKLLSEDYNTLKTPYNYNTTLGVVITIREYLSPLYNIFICEMGAKKLGEIEEICNIVHPRIAVLTSIGPMHLESFGSMENIEKTKFELIDSTSKSGGKAFLNYDDETIRNHKTPEMDIISYGIENENADYRPFDIKTTSMGSTFKLKFPGDDEVYTLSTKLLGRHNVLNLAGGIAVAHNMGVDKATIIRRCKLISSPKHRLELKQTSFGLMIDDAYNSNPSGAKAALEVLNEFDMVKILVTPGMVELGEKEYQLNYEFGEQASKVCDKIILVGKGRTKPLQDAIKKSDFDMKNLIICDTVNQAIGIISNMKFDKDKIVLFENDLPDNY